MQDAVVNKIKSKIAHGKFGEVYFVSSFPQYDVEYVTKLLAIFVNRKASKYKAASIVNEAYFVEQ